MPDFCHLVCVTSVNNNKFYDMQDLGNGEFEAKYGRIGATCTTVRYPMSRWYSIYNQKLKKGYIDQTSLVSVAQVQTNEKYKPIEDEDVAKLIAYLREKARDTVAKNYTVASTQVSAAMVAKAQSIINRLYNTASNLTVAQFNDDLIELFGVIPRKMSYVPDYLASRASEFPNIIHREQQLLDVMAGQVSGDVVEQKTTGNENETVLEAFGLEFSPRDRKGRVYHQEGARPGVCPHVLQSMAGGKQGYPEEVQGVLQRQGPPYQEATLAWEPHRKLVGHPAVRAGSPAHERHYQRQNVWLWPVFCPQGKEVRPLHFPAGLYLRPRELQLRVPVAI